MQKLMNALMFSCQKATELVEKKMYFRLTAKEKIQLFLHTGMCKACKHYKKQSEWINQVMQGFRYSETSVGSSLSTAETDGFKNKLKQSLEN